MLFSQRGSVFTPLWCRSQEKPLRRRAGVLREEKLPGCGAGPREARSGGAVYGLPRRHCLPTMGTHWILGWPGALSNIQKLKGSRLAT